MSQSTTLFLYMHAPTTELDSLSLHDALPISARPARGSPPTKRPSVRRPPREAPPTGPSPRRPPTDRKSTRLNSSHVAISYAVFCLKKKKNTQITKATKTQPKSKDKQR